MNGDLEKYDFLNMCNLCRYICLVFTGPVILCSCDYKHRRLENLRRSPTVIKQNSVQGYIKEGKRGNFSSENNLAPWTVLLILLHIMDLTWVQIL